MGMKLKRIATALLAGVIFAGAFAGCSFGGKTVMKINGEKISDQLYLGAVGQMYNTYSQNFGMEITDMLGQDFGEGMTGENLLKDAAVNFLKEFEAIKKIAEDNDAKLNSEEKAELKKQKKQLVENQGGRSEYLSLLEESHITEEFADYANEVMFIYDKIYSELFSGDGKFAASVDTMEETLSDGYVRVKHVLVQANDPEAEDYNEKLKTAEDIAKRAKAGEDFDALIEEFGEDPGMESSPEGYIFDANGYDVAQSGQMVAEFTTASHALKDNGVSDVVTTSHGFHIIKRYPITSEFIEQYSEKLSLSFAPEIMYNEINKIIDSMAVETTDEYEKINLFEFFGIDAPDAPVAPEADKEPEADNAENAWGDSSEGTTEPAPQAE